MNSAIRMLICSEAEADLYAYRCGRGREPGIVVRIIRGKRCSVLDRCMAEWGAAMQLPYCFEGTWPSLRQSLEELNWPAGTTLVLVLTNVNRMLPRLGEDFNQLMQAVADVAAGRSSRQRPGAPAAVEVILHAEPRHAEETRRRLAAANVSFAPIEE